jgi:pyruvate kinase
VPPLNHVPRTQRDVPSFAARDIGERLSRALVAFFPATGPQARPPAHPAAVGLHAEARGAQPAGDELGVRPLSTSYLDDAMVRQVDNAILSIGRFKAGDTVVIVAGSPPGTSGSTNLIRVHRLGEDDHA